MQNKGRRGGAVGKGVVLHLINFTRISEVDKDRQPHINIEKLKK